MPPTPEATPPAEAAPTEAGGTPAAAGRVHDHGPCRYPGCGHVGVRLYGQHCPQHVMAELARVFGQMEAAAASDPIEAGVREAGVRGAARPPRWRSEDKGYGRIVGLCLRFYRAQGWPPTDHPKAVDIGHLIAKEKGEVPGEDDAQRVFAVLRSAKRRTGRRHLFSEAQEDARASYEAEQRPA